MLHLFIKLIIIVFTLFGTISLPIYDVSARSKKRTQSIIKDLQIIGNKKIEKTAIIDRIKSQVGKRFNKKTVRDDIASLFKMGHFYNIEVKSRFSKKGLVLTYTVYEKPSIIEVKYIGHKELSKKDLDEISEIKSYQILNETKVLRAVENIKKQYEEKGYFLVRVKSKVVDVKKGETVRIEFHISENDKIKVKKITLLGNEAISNSDILSVMGTKEKGFFSFLTGSGSYRQDIFDRDIQMINFLYFDRGYIQAKINQPQIYITPNKKHIYITIRIEEGEQFNIAEVNFSGDILFTRDELIKDLLSLPNKVFSYGSLHKDLATLQAKYGDLGYAFVNIIPQTKLIEKNRSIDITYEIDKGEKVYFGEFDIIGNTKTRDKVLRRELKIFEGELYNTTRKKESEANVRRLGYFEDVKFNIKTSVEKQDVVDLEISVKERNTGSIQVGAGYNSATGMVFNGQLQQSNLFGRGQRLALTVDLNKTDSIFNISFTEPYFYDTKWSLGGDLYRRRIIQTGEYGESVIGGAVRIGHPILPYFYGFLRYRYDETKVTLDTYNPNPELYPVETVNGRTSSITGTLEYDKRNDRLTPSDGFFASTSIEYAGLGGDISYIRGTGNIRFYHTILWDIVFRSNVSYGIIDGQGSQPPFTELYRLGGPNTLRGYEYRSVGLALDNKPPGGRQQTYFNLELEFPLVTETKMRGVVFYDTGYADDILNFNHFRSNFGVGVRWFSPIGPLRFEWGFPINRQNKEQTSVFNFAIGSPF